MRKPEVRAQELKTGAENEWGKRGILKRTEEQTERMKAEIRKIRQRKNR